jgi:hypothetical protein
MGTCVFASCTTDADCGSNLNCSSHTPSPGCPSTSFACQTSTDQCGGDADCPVTAQCSLQMGHRVCANKGCAIGRPFLIGTEERLAPIDLRDDWTAEGARPDVGHLTAAERTLLAQAWTDVALMEHASIAAFARFTLHAMSVGAPSSIIERSNAAMADETLHAKLAFGIASGYAGYEIGPGALDIDGALDRKSWREILVTTIREGCIGETVAAVEAAEALEYATDPEIRRALTRIAEDEARHAELAWQFVRWAIESGSEDVRRWASDEFARAQEPSGETEASPTRKERVLLSGGIVPERLRRLIRREAMSRIVLVCAEALLGPHDGRRDGRASARAA